MNYLNRWNISYLTGGLLLLAAALLYVLTLDNGLRPDELSGGDLITHQYAQVEGRPSNAPGYPLYTLGGWLWFRLGRLLLGWVLNPIEILSFYSTLWGLASLAILYLILFEVTSRQWPIAFLLTAFYAVTYFFWYYSVTTEQYSSAVFQTLLAIWLAFRWDETPTDKTLLWLAFISGTMLANMVTTLFILPPLLWFILFRQEGSDLTLYRYLKRPRLILQTAAVVLLPLLSYVYIYVRGAQHPEWRGAGRWPTTWAWFVEFITIRQGRDELAPGLTWRNILTGEFPGLMGQELTWLIFIGGFMGLACLGRRRAIFLGSTLIIYFIFCWGYRFGNWFQVIIPAYPIFIIGFAAGLTKIKQWLSRQISQSRPLFIIHHSSFIILLTLLFLYRFSASLPRANQRDLPGDTGLDPGWAILADRPVSPVLIVSDFEEWVALQYLRSVWGVAQGITPLDVSAVDLKAAWREGDQALYISRRAAGVAPEVVLSEPVYPQAAGEQLVALLAAPLTQLPVTAKVQEVEFGESLQLIGWELAQSAPLPDEVGRRLRRANWQIALYWQTSAKLAEDYTISVRPLVSGEIVKDGQEAVIQDHQPVWGFYPTGRWQPGVVVRDVYALTLPPDSGLPEAVQIVVYKSIPSGFENLAEQTISLSQR
jgi:hypothetical protein